MCDKLPNETTTTWLVRVCCKHPSALLSLVCMAATATMYCDNRASKAELLAAYKENTQLMSDVRAELKTLRDGVKQLDGWHHQQFLEEYKKSR